MQGTQWLKTGLLLSVVTLGHVGRVLAFDGDDSVRALPAQDFFERHVRPILVAKCLACHGPRKQESGLRLDSRAALLRGGDRGPAVDLKLVDRSLLLRAIRHDGDLEMPPAGKLAEAELDAFERWITLGLPWPDRNTVAVGRSDRNDSHWAFQQPLQHPPPNVRRLDWVRTPIDRFVLRKQEQAGLQPALPASRQTLIRRATFDLLGLPPTPDEVATFVADDAPDAFDRLVDRLLTDPRYGQRWGRHWLDVARYADNKGYVFFEDKNYPWAYTYRDYVVGAWNEDLPFDRFVLEQLAADQLGTTPSAESHENSALAAMGFLTLGGHFMNNTHDIIDDRIDVVTRGLLGLTVTCARCHDHKYDPIPQRDYYSLYGVFRSCYEPTLPPLVDPPPQTEAYREFSAEMTKRHDALMAFVTGKHKELVDDGRTRIAQYLLAAHARHGQPPADNFMLLVDKGDINPTMILRWQRYLEDSGRDPKIWSIWRMLSKLPADQFDKQAAEVAAACAQSHPLVAQAFSTMPIDMEEVAQRYETLLKTADQEWLELLEKTVAAGGPPAVVLPDADWESLRRVLYAPGSPPQAPLSLDWGFLSLFPDRPTQAEYKKLLKAVEEWSSAEKGSPPRAMVLYERDTVHDPHIFLRGNPNRLGETVPRQFLGLLDRDRQPFQTGSGRLELARAIVDPNNPLTARVVVNRIWLHHFGTGLVLQASDFGVRSDPPSHPHLLDWLATSLIQNGWSIKWLHRQIMLSSVYRQQSVASSQSYMGDPENRLLTRMYRRRLEFEALRDSMLAVSGRLNLAVGGPPVDLYGSSAKLARRSIYGFIDRMDVSPLLTTFDFPNPAATSAARSQTTVPPQALHFMNSVAVNNEARRLSQRPDVIAVDESAARIELLYQLVLARKPTAEELQLALEFVGPTPTSDQWQQIAHALLMTNEFAFID
jgi:cytochrome c553